VAAALQIWSPTFSKAFDSLPSSVRELVQRKVDEMGERLSSFPHKRLEGRPEFKLRVGDYRVLY
jgi:mRNA-degrading endonuclease RelE of RelBE toxin-antitoxin system